MKKAYKKPNTMVTAVITTQMIAESITVNSTESYNSSTMTIGTKEREDGSVDGGMGSLW